MGQRRKKELMSDKYSQLFTMGGRRPEKWDVDFSEYFQLKKESE